MRAPSRSRAHANSAPPLAGVGATHADGVVWLVSWRWWRAQVGDEGMSLEQLGEIIQVDASDIVRSLFMKGIMLSMNQVRAVAASLHHGQHHMRLRACVDSCLVCARGCAL